MQVISVISYYDFLNIFLFFIYLHRYFNVGFFSDGQKYFVGFYKHVDVYSVADASIEFSIKLNGRSNDVAFLDDTTFALAGEMPHIEIYSLVTKELLHKFEAHETRVRCLAFIEPSCLISASNDGLVKVWKVSRDNDSFDIKEDGSVDTKCRVTSMQVRFFLSLYLCFLIFRVKSF